MPRQVRVRRMCSAVAAVGGLLLSAAPGPAAQSVTVKGSDTMVLLAQRWAEVYQGQHPEVSVQVTGGGSGTGIAALINRTCDIANCSRDLKADERRMAVARGIEVMEFRVALDAICVVVSSANPVSELSIDQLRGIFTGAINRWVQVGGSPGPILR